MKHLLVPIDASARSAERLARAQAWQVAPRWVDGSQAPFWSLLSQGPYADLMVRLGPDDIGDALLLLAVDAASDLMVMGFHGHSRAPVWALGGTTRTVLESMTRPVLVLH